jgi:hypothetical protein
MHNTTGRRQTAHLETLITAYFEQPDSMHEKTNG